MTESVQIDTAAIALVDALLLDRPTAKKRLADYSAMQATVLAAEQDFEAKRGAYASHEAAVIAEVGQHAKDVFDFRKMVLGEVGDIERALELLSASEAAWNGLGLPENIPLRPVGDETMNGGSDNE
jgi:hypothetical protein